MTITGQIRDGMMVPDEPLGMAQGVRVQIVLSQEQCGSRRRQGGWLKGQSHIADDFDHLPDDIVEAFRRREP